MRTLSAQRQAIEHCLAALESLSKGEYEDHLAVARQGCLTLGWFERRQELVRRVADLDKAAPGLAALLETFPDARIEVRNVNGS